MRGMLLRIGAQIHGSVFKSFQTLHGVIIKVPKDDFEIMCELAGACAQPVFNCSELARIGRPDISRAVPSWLMQPLSRVCPWCFFVLINDGCF